MKDIWFCTGYVEDVPMLPPIIVADNWTINDIRRALHAASDVGMAPDEIQMVFAQHPAKPLKVAK